MDLATGQGAGDAEGKRGNAGEGMDLHVSDLSG
jgi:hypothetical protein